MHSFFTLRLKREKISTQSPRTGKKQNKSLDIKDEAKKKKKKVKGKFLYYNIPSGLRQRLEHDAGLPKKMGYWEIIN